jgi:RNA polymerase sigma-70 factor (ECF subfamily)
VELGSSASPEGVSDEALLAGLVSGDAAAGWVFIRRFQSRVFGLALGVVHDPALAEDIAQEAFFRAWKHGLAYDARRGTVSTWLLHITRNLALDAARLRRAEVIDPDVLTSLAAPTDATGVEDAAVTSVSAAAVRVALQRLPVEQSRALLLAAYYGRTAEEISRSEGIPLGTAKTRIRLGLRKLRAVLMAPAEETQ